MQPMLKVTQQRAERIWHRGVCRYLNWPTMGNIRPGEKADVYDCLYYSATLFCHFFARCVDISANGKLQLQWRARVVVVRSEGSDGLYWNDWIYWRDGPRWRYRPAGSRRATRCPGTARYRARPAGTQRTCRTNWTTWTYRRQRYATVCTLLSQVLCQQVSK